MALSGRTPAWPRPRSNRQAWQTSGTRATPDVKADAALFQILLHAARAASSPKALPPDSRMAWMAPAAAIGLSSSLSRLAGPPPAHIQPGGRAVRAEQQHGAAGGGFGVLRVADGDAGQGGEGDLLV